MQQVRSYPPVHEPSHTKINLDVLSFIFHRPPSQVTKCPRETLMNILSILTCQICFHMMWLTCVHLYRMDIPFSIKHKHLSRMSNDLLLILLHLNFKCPIYGKLYGTLGYLLLYHRKPLRVVLCH